MNCDESRQLLAELEVGVLPHDQRQRVQEHLAGCESCRAVLEELRLVGSWLDAARPVGPSRDLWPSIAAALPPRRRPLGQRVSDYLGLSPGWALVGAACACAVLVFGALLGQGSERPVEVTETTIAEADEDADLLSRWSVQASLAGGPVGRYAAAAALSLLPELAAEEGSE